MYKIRTAELNVEIDYKYETMIKQAEIYKSDFEKADIKISVRDETIEQMKREYPNLTLNDCEYLLTGAAFYNDLLKYNGFMLHSSTVVVDNKAYMFSAPSGTGKSTHTQLWLEEFGERAYILNDDKPAIRIFEDGIYAYGTPWSGKTDLNINEKVPVRAIVFIERAEENSIVRLDAQEAVKMMIYQGYRTRAAKATAAFFDMVEEIMRKINIYRLYCNISREAVLTAYEGINGGIKNEN